MDERSTINKSLSDTSEDLRVESLIRIFEYLISIEVHQRLILVHQARLEAQMTGKDVDELLDQMREAFHAGIRTGIEHFCLSFGMSEEDIAEELGEEPARPKEE